jgi:hypothetical protein
LFKSITYYYGAFLLVILIGCEPAPATNTIVASVQSPDKRVSALLVDRSFEAARISDGFFLIVIPASHNVTDAINANDINETAVLIATGAGTVQLRWQDDNTLLVVCDSCGIKPVDISKKLDHIGTTRIVYRGFPAHTAYS